MIELVKGWLLKLLGQGKTNKTVKAKAKGSVKGDSSWKHYIAYVFVFLIMYNYVIIPVVLVVFGVYLPPVVLDDVIKMLVLILSGT